MNPFLSFIQTYESWFYFLFGVVVLIYLRRLILAIEEIRSSLFGLEREHAQNQLGFSLSIIGLVFVMAFVVFVLNSFFIPALPKLYPATTATIDILATATETLTTDGTPAVEASQTTAVVTGLTQTVTPTPSSEGCIADQVDWTSPQPGEELSGTVVLKGTVNVLNLGFYKYEFSPAGSDKWTTIAADNKIVRDDVLGQWNTSPYASGDYLLRLVVTRTENNTNVVMPACVVPVKITQ